MARWALVLLLVLSLAAAEQGRRGRNTAEEKDEPGQEDPHTACAQALGEGATADDQGQCRCAVGHEFAGDRCVRKGGAVDMEGRTAWETLGREDMPACSGARKCSKELQELLTPGAELLGECLEGVHKSRAELLALQAQLDTLMRESEALSIETRDQAQNLRVQNQRLLMELEMLSGQGLATEKVQRSMRKMVTENDGLKREIGSAKKRAQKRRTEVQLIEAKGRQILEQFEENVGRLKDVYADNDVKVPVAAK